MMAKAVLLLASLVFLGIGVVFLVAPVHWATLVEIELPTSMARTDLRATYGGFDLGWSVVVRDITQRKREEQQRRLLSSITVQSPDAILSIDSEGRITSWNLGAEKMYGYSATEIVGRPWLELAPPEREADYRMAVSPGKPDSPQVVDTLARARGGRLLPVRLSASVLRVEDGGEIEVWGDGEQTRTFLHIDECLDGVLRLMRSDWTGPVNIGSEEMVTINQLAALAARIADKRITIRHIPGPLGVRGRRSDNQLIFKKLQWKPSRPLEYGIRRTYAWIEEGAWSFMK